MKEKLKIAKASIFGMIMVIASVALAFFIIFLFKDGLAAKGFYSMWGETSADFKLLFVGLCFISISNFTKG